MASTIPQSPQQKRKNENRTLKDEVATFEDYKEACDNYIAYWKVFIDIVENDTYFKDIVKEYYDRKPEDTVRVSTSKLLKKIQLDQNNLQTFRDELASWTTDCPTITNEKENVEGSLSVASYNLNRGRTDPTEEDNLKSYQLRMILEKKPNLLMLQEHPAQNRGFRFPELKDEQHNYEVLQTTYDLWFAWDQKVLQLHPQKNTEKYFDLNDKIVYVDFIFTSKTGKVNVRAYNLHLYSEPRRVVNFKALRALNLSITESIANNYICVVCGDFNYDPDFIHYHLKVIDDYSSPDVLFPTRNTTFQHKYDTCMFLPSHRANVTHTPEVIWLPECLDTMLTFASLSTAYLEQKNEFKIQAQVEIEILEKMKNDPDAESAETKRFQAMENFETYQLPRLLELYNKFFKVLYDKLKEQSDKIAPNRILDIFVNQFDNSFYAEWKKERGDHALVFARAEIVDKKPSSIASPTSPTSYYVLQSGVPSSQVATLMNYVKGVGEALKYSNEKISILLPSNPSGPSSYYAPVTRWTAFKILSVIGTRYDSTWDVVLVQESAERGLQRPVNVAYHGREWKLAFDEAWISKNEKERAQKFDKYASNMTKLDAGTREQMIRRLFRYGDLENALHKLYEYRFLGSPEPSESINDDYSGQLLDPIQLLEQSFAAIGLESATTREGYPKQRKLPPMYIGI
jgi:endonuclease/exonuclease/phosphatase family metal-dependent hydrolase